MNRSVMILGLLGLLPLAYAAGWTAARPRTALYENRELGFRIAAPEFKPFTSGVGGTLAVLFGPVERGGISSVNISMQPTNNADEYLKAARESLEEGGATVLRAEKKAVGGKEAVLIEAKGMIAGSKKHALTLCVFRESHTLSVSCSTSIEQFAELKTAFETCLESLSLDETPGAGK